MKKYVLILLAFLSITLSGCAIDDDYCGNGSYVAEQLRPKVDFHPNQFYVNNLEPSGFKVIHNESEFQRRVYGAKYYRNEIDFRYYSLIIGEVEIFDFQNIIDIIPIYSEACNSRSDNILEVEFKVNRGRRKHFVTYHAVVPKSNSDFYRVRTEVRYYNRY
ncbi:hypothetical protein VSO92_00895 [Myroides pelagicus]|uniref:hypothetical protein n=1 Tax=Myroides pelagicus TaxID=270914 RepID=UPI002DBBAC35|nr:hypothetical protein [Myroides pelagicus]MEC4112674.1 hypothetical protein [Myroides pelagicus]